MWHKSKIKLSQTSKTQIPTKLKNSSCDKTQSLKLWQNSKNLIMKGKNIKATKIKNPNCNKTTQIKFWHKSTTQMFSKFKNENCDKTQKF